jgi:dTDP-4-dehydrorhamnose reductase
MKVLLMGSKGQLGWELQRTCPDSITLLSYDMPEIDFRSNHSISQCINETQPDIIINAAAYTAVDKAEAEPEQAFAVNYKAVAFIAELCLKAGIFMVHISTDFVFSGESFRPYKPDDAPSSASVYGESKLKGEEAVRHTLPDKQYIIIRTAWLYSAHGHNFVKTMLGLMNSKRINYSTPTSSIKVIDEQIGTPTWAFGLALAIWSTLEKKLTGIFHYTDAGVASWYDFAVAIQEEGIQIGLLNSTVAILPVPAIEYPSPAPRPMYSVLDKSSFWQAMSIKPVHWRVQLRRMLREISD